MFEFWLGINACAAFVRCSLRSACKHLLIVERGFSSACATEKIKPPRGGLIFLVEAQGLARHKCLCRIRKVFATLCLQTPTHSRTRVLVRLCHRKNKTTSRWFNFSGGGTGTRTLDPMIKSHLLYQLSYASKTDFLSAFGGNFATNKNKNQEKITLFYSGYVSTFCDWYNL